MRCTYEALRRLLERIPSPSTHPHLEAMMRNIARSAPSCSVRPLLHIAGGGGHGEFVYRRKLFFFCPLDAGQRGNNSFRIHGVSLPSTFVLQSIGFGGTVMTTAQDYIICEVIDESTAECTDRQSVSRCDPQGHDHLFLTGQIWGWMFVHANNVGSRCPGKVIYPILSVARFDGFPRSYSHTAVAKSSPEYT